MMRKCYLVGMLCLNLLLVNFAQAVTWDIVDDDFNRTTIASSDPYIPWGGVATTIDGSTVYEPNSNAYLSNGIYHVDLTGTSDINSNLWSPSPYANYVDYRMLYTYETRFKVDQFSSSSDPFAITLAHVKDRNSMYAYDTSTFDNFWFTVGLQGSQLNIGQNQIQGTYSSVNVTTSEGVWYTWRFVVDKATRTIDIYRQAEGATTFETVALNVAVGTPDWYAATQILGGFSITYVDTVTDPIFNVDYIRMGTGEITEPVVATPVFAPSGPYISGPVTISCATAGASIYYTTDGTTPSETNGTLYSAEITVSPGETLQAVAIAAGYSDSSVISQQYILETVWDILNDNFNRMTIASSDPYVIWGGVATTIDGYTIYEPNSNVYVNNGIYHVDLTGTSDINTNLWSPSPYANYVDYRMLYTYETRFKVDQFSSSSDPFAIMLANIKDRNSMYAYDTSTFDNFWFTVGLQGSQLNIGQNQIQGTYSSVNVTTSEGVWYTWRFVVDKATRTIDIYRQAEGSTTFETVALNVAVGQPDWYAGTQILGGFAITYADTVTDPIFDIDYIRMGTGEITAPVIEALVFSPEGPDISAPTDVTITCATAGTSIYYTTDGTTPSETNGTLCTGAITIGDGDILQAISLATGYVDSGIAIMSYHVPSIPILAWYSIPQEEISEARFQELHDAGFTHSYSLYSTYQLQFAVSYYALKANIKLILDTRAGDFSYFVDKFKDHPVLEAYFIQDEPSSGDFPDLAIAVQQIQAMDPDHWCYINLYPSTDSSYYETFLDTVPVDVLSFDRYPIKTSIDPDFYNNLEIVSSAAKDEGIPFWAFALSCAHGDYPVPTLSHLRFQVFSDLAYGAQGIQYFTYWQPDPINGDYDDAPIDADGNRTPIWYVVQSMNQEIKGLSPVFLGAEVKSVGHTGTLPIGTTAYANSAPITSLTTSGSDGAVVSRLVNGHTWYLAVVNRDIDSTMTLNMQVDTTRGVCTVSKDGIETAVGSGTVSYSVEPADIVVFKWNAIPGDANMDDAVDVGDLGILAANYGTTEGATWAQGDFTGDGAVDVGDLGVLAANYGMGSSSSCNFDTDYAKVFGVSADADNESTTDDYSDSTLCSSVGFPLIAGLALMCLLLVKLDE